MNHSTQGKDSPFPSMQFDAQRNELFLAIKYPNPTSVMGFEALSIGENFDLFFKELSATIDKRMALLAKTIHSVDFDQAKKHLAKDGVLYVKNTSTEILTPDGYTPGMGNMMGYTKAVVGSVYVIGSLKTEAARLYDWMKQIITKGRMETEFRWAISEFDMAVTKSEEFIKNLPDTPRQLRYNLGQVYISYDEIWDVIGTFNNTVKTLGGRDVELTAKSLKDVYDLGQLLVKKIRANDILLTPEAIRDINMIVNKFAELTNVCGAMMILLNELTAVFTSQVASLKNLRY